MQPFTTYTHTPTRSPVRTRSRSDSRSLETTPTLPYHPPQISHQSPSSEDFRYWQNLTSDSPDLFYAPPTYPPGAWIRHRSEYHRSSGSMSPTAVESVFGRSDHAGSTSPTSPTSPTFQSTPVPPMLQDRQNDDSDLTPTESHLQVSLRKLMKLLWKLLVILLCFIACLLWSLACLVLINFCYCIVATCLNCAHHRTGGCHDCPLICDGMERSLAWSIWGCQQFLRIAKQIIAASKGQTGEVDDQGSRRGGNTITPPSRLYPNPTRNAYFSAFAYTFDNAVDGLNRVADRAVDASDRMMFSTLYAVADAGAPEHHRRRDDDVWC